MPCNTDLQIKINYIVISKILLKDYMECNPNASPFFNIFFTGDLRNKGVVLKCFETLEHWAFVQYIHLSSGGAKEAAKEQPMGGSIKGGAGARGVRVMCPIDAYDGRPEQHGEGREISIDR